MVSAGERSPATSKLRLATWHGTVHPYGNTMRFSVRFLRHKGRALPWKQEVNREPLVGDLRIEECMDANVKRNVRIARLHDPMVVIADTLPTLLDVHIIAMSPQAFTLSGLERMDGAEYAQVVSDCDALVLRQDRLESSASPGFPCDATQPA